MELLNFDMPAYARIAWVSKEVKDLWEPKFKLAAEAYKKLEVETVASGLRKCTVMHIYPDEFMDKVNELSEKGLIFLPIKKVGSYSGFAHAHPPVTNDKDWFWYGVIARNIKDAKKFSDYSEQHQIDHIGMGELLGYPECCTDFFNNVWTKGFYDPVWQQAEHVDDKYIMEKNEHLIKLNHTLPFESNVLLRYIGLRITPHIPCSLHCEKTHDIAKEWINLAHELKIEGIKELEDFLKLPVEWDCLKGIAYVSTPLFKIETNSMTCYPNHVIQKMGTFYPEFLPRGLKFPHRMEQSIPKEIIASM